MPVRKTIPPDGQNLKVIAQALAIVVVGYCVVRVWTYATRLRPDPQAIIVAMSPPPKDGPYYDEEEIFRAIQEFGDVNGSAKASGARTRISFLEMAVIQERRSLVKLLLEHGADPDRQHEPGGTPLFHSIERGDDRTARAWLHAGAKWSGPSRVPGKTVEEWAAEHAPDLFRRLRYVRPAR